ncbi:putative ammonia monooxygenase [Roseivivax marinus]|uniref:Putative ammonia monooxygenase n=1 Tax=Roseivivax marinus TaxID=1379903 RepID=W4HI16_9RHOB|nr:AbrB family transcriptional regulator [Roseivivax marinus]ETW12048.1 putative ammonia monooxygenase [Roseivivax marinus]
MTSESEERAPDGRRSDGNGAARLARLALLFTLSALGGLAFERLGAPLPWMIGPLVISAAIFVSGAIRVGVPTGIRPFGQVVVACQVGLAFSPEAFAMLVQLAPAIVGTALMTGLCIFVVALILSRLAGISLAQAFLCGVPTSPVEAAGMAIRAGIDPMPVVLSQTLRLSAVVVALPFALYALDGWPDARRAFVRIEPVDPMNLALLAAIGVAAATTFRRLRVPNPNFLGPLSVCALLAVTDHAPAPFPGMVLALAQVVLGTWLGSTFRRELMGAAGRMAAAFLGATLLVLILCSGGAILIGRAAGLDWRTMVLGAAPGGVVEMALTAKFLGQNVALITSFHLTRIFILMPSIPWLVRLISRYETRTPKTEKTDAR